MIIDDARDDLSRAEKALTAHSWSLAGQLIIDAVRSLIDAKLSPAPVGEDGVVAAIRADRARIVAEVETSNPMLARTIETMDIRAAPTPPATTSDGGEAEKVVENLFGAAYSLQSGLGEANWTIEAIEVERSAIMSGIQMIRDLEQRLAEAELTLETVTLSARQQEASPDLRQFSTQLAEAERQRDETTALVERLRGAPKVRPLIWDGNVASTPFGAYTVCEDDDDWSYTFHNYPYGDPDAGHITEEGAKAAAQADYEKRILSALLSEPQASEGRDG